jgi:tetratricopeptide (TPR) repeat protein
MRLAAAATFAASLLLAQPKPATSAKALCAPPADKASPSLPAKLMDGMGQVHFPITTRSPEAQKFFNQGVAQMHSFWAREAERSFLQAAALDPEAPMPWWGVAMVAVGDFRPQFQLDSAVEVGGKMSNTNPRVKNAVLRMQQLAGNATGVEKAYMDAIAARRSPTAKDPTADYLNSLRALIKRYPTEVEARLYLALQAMRGFHLPAKTPRAGTMEAVEILRQLRNEAPEHPGLHHFIIHAWEGSTFAEDAEASSHKYAQLAPGIPHALHMPGHIFSQTGKWSVAADYFEQCKAKEIEFMNADQLYGSGHHGHNVHYLASSYSFNGEVEKALETAKGLLAYKQNPREAEAIDAYQSAYRQAQFAILRTLVQHERWDTILDGQNIPVIDRPRPRAWRHWAIAMAHAAKGQIAEAEAERARMDQAVEDLTKMTFDKQVPELRVAQLELRGHMQIASGKVDEGFKTLQLASDREIRLRYMEPPWYPRPVAEAHGWTAIRHSRIPEARRAFSRALEQYPASARALAGQREASQLKSGNTPSSAGGL